MDAVLPILSFQEGRHREDPLFVEEDAFHQICRGRADAEFRRLFAFDDDHPALPRIFQKVILRKSVLSCSESADPHGIEGDHGGVPVFTQTESLDGGSAGPRPSADRPDKTGCIEKRPGPEGPLFFQFQALSHIVSDDVAGIRN